MSIALLGTAIDGFSRELAATHLSDFSRPTKCDGWDVTALLRHIVGGAVSAGAACKVDSANVWSENRASSTSAPSVSTPSATAPAGALAFGLTVTRPVTLSSSMV